MTTLVDPQLFLSKTGFRRVTATSVPVSGITGMGANVETFLVTPTSANLADAVTDETGTGALVFATSPTLAGTPLAPTAAPGTNTTQIATTAFVTAAIGAIGDSDPFLAQSSNLMALVVLTRAAYNALSPPDANTMYFIDG